jgi:hypothetical protein
LEGHYRSTWQQQVEEEEEKLEREKRREIRNGCCFSVCVPLPPPQPIVPFSLAVTSAMMDDRIPRLHIHTAIRHAG